MNQSLFIFSECFSFNSLCSSRCSSFCSELALVVFLLICLVWWVGQTGQKGRWFGRVDLIEINLMVEPFLQFLMVGFRLGIIVRFLDSMGWGQVWSSDQHLTIQILK